VSLPTPGADAHQLVQSFTFITPQSLESSQVIGLDDVERLLGKRPFSSQEMRNIDRYRHGPSGKPPPPSPPLDEKQQAENGGGPGKDGDGGNGEEPALHGRLEPGAVVAT